MATSNTINGWLTLVIAVVAAVPGTLAGLAAYNKAADTHDLVNSRMTEMLAVVKSEAAAKATLVEKAKEEAKESAKALKEEMIVK